MSRPTLTKGGYHTIMVGNGAGPEVFQILCGFKTRNFTHQINTSDTFTADCDDPEDVPARNVNLTGEQWDLSGTGQYNRGQAALIRGLVGVPKNYRFKMGEPAADSLDDGYWQGQAVLTNHQTGAEDGSYVTASITIVSDGPWVWVDA